MMSSTSEDKIHLLIVSCHAGARRRLEEALKNLGYETFSVPDGEAALGVLKQRRVDVAVTSFELLGMNGIQLCRAISRIHPHVPIVLMAQNPEPGLVAQALSSGATDLVSEETLPEEMHTTIQRNIERKSAAAHRLVTDRAETLFKAIRVVTAAIDAKSHYAARHSSRVTQLSLMIGKRIGLSPEQTITLELAAQLHDIGKIGTPEEVLTKPGMLTDEEWVDVLKHPALGSAFLAAVPELSEIASAVRHHHEHYDGTGYPDGLQGPAIPLFARIIAVADAYDAMTSDRPYRKTKTHQEAAKELELHSGKQFDTVLVHQLLAALSEEPQERKAA